MKRPDEPVLKAILRLKGNEDFEALVQFLREDLAEKTKRLYPRFQQTMDREHLSGECNAVHQILETIDDARASLTELEAAP